VLASVALTAFVVAQTVFHTPHKMSNRNCFLCWAMPSWVLRPPYLHVCITTQVLIRLSRDEDGQLPYSAPAANLFNELTKLVVSVALWWRYDKDKEYNGLGGLNFQHFALFAIPGDSQLASMPHSAPLQRVLGLMKNVALQIRVNLRCPKHTRVLRSRLPGSANISGSPFALPAET
jgi:hypothetical protein